MNAESSRLGRPAMYIDMCAVTQLLPSMSIRQISKRLGVHFNTLSYRLRKGGVFESVSSGNPFCVIDRARMRRVKSAKYGEYFLCIACGVNTLPPATRRLKSHIIGRPPRDIDNAKVSELLRDRPVIDVAQMLGVHRNIIYRRIGLGLIAARPFRTWTPRGSREALSLYWPYMEANDPRYEGVIREVNEAVSRQIPDATRSDICQEIVVSVLMGEITREQIRAAVRSHIQRHYKMFPTKGYQTVSLDAPLRSNGRDGQERRLIDLIDAESYQEKISTFRYSESLADCSTANELAQRLADKWDADRLLSDRKSYSTFKKASGERFSDPACERLRRKYRLFNNRVHSFGFEGQTLGGAWTIETALPEELREQDVFAISDDQQPSKRRAGVLT